MRAPAFWWRDRMTLAAFLLAPIGFAYGFATLIRMKRRGHRSQARVICIGNPVAGGAGKTPAAIAVADILTGMNEPFAFLTRGYGGSSDGPLVVDVTRHGADEVGDEPLLLARHAPTVVARDRVAGAAYACTTGARTILMDDGFQNPSLQKDLSLLVIDGHVGIGNDLCIPAGPLRAPFIDQLGQCDAVMVIGEGVAGRKVADLAQRHGKPVLTARIEADEKTADRLRGRKVVAYAGLGRPEKFAVTLRQLGAEVVALHPLDDHRMPTQAEAETILRQAQDTGALVVATEKDVVKLAPHPHMAALAAATVAVPVTLVFDDAEAVRQLLAAAISAA